MNATVLTFNTENTKYSSPRFCFLNAGSGAQSVDVSGPFLGAAGTLWSPPANQLQWGPTHTGAPYNPETTPLTSLVTSLSFKTPPCRSALQSPRTSSTCLGRTTSIWRAIPSLRPLAPHGHPYCKKVTSQPHPESTVVFGSVIVCLCVNAALHGNASSRCHGGDLLLNRDLD